MTRTDVKASSGPQATETAAARKRSLRAMSRLVALPVVLLLALALAAPTLAATSTNKEGLSGYSTTPKSGTAPSKTTKTPTTPAKTTPAPATEPAPATASSVPTTTPKASTLPFTGFDLRWTVGGGLLLMAMGFSIVMLQRRERGGSSR